MRRPVPSADRVAARGLGVTAMTFALAGALFRPRALVLDDGVVAGVLLAGAALLAVQAYCALRGIERVRDVARWAFWGVLVSALYVLPMYVLARRPLPFQDEALRMADARLGVDVAWLVRWTRAHPWADGLSNAAYRSLPFGCLAALLVPPLAGLPQRTRTLLGALAVASFATLGIYATFRAIGPWEAYAGLAPTADQRACSEACRALAARAPFVPLAPLAVDLQRPDPLIAFPSWHTLLAMLSAAALDRVPRLRAVSWIWAGAVAVSTVTTGWHYAVDTLAGVALAAGSWSASMAVTRG